MKWSDVRKTCPNKYVLLKALKSHVEDEKKYIDEVALVRIIEDEKEASDLLIRCKGDTFVFHTAKEELAMIIVMNPVLRGAYKYGNSI